MTQQEFSGPMMFQPQGFAGQAPYAPSYAGPGVQHTPSGAPMTAGTRPSQFPPAPAQGPWIPSVGKQSRKLLVAVWCLAALLFATAVLSVIIRVQMSGDIDTLEEAGRQDQAQISTLQGQAAQDQNQLTQVQQAAAADAECNQDAQQLIKWLKDSNPDQSAGQTLVGQLETDCVPPLIS